MSYCDDISLEVYLPAPGAFVLDQSYLSASDHMGPITGGSYIWQELIGETSQVYIGRGADVSLGVFARADAGEMQFTYHEANFNPFYRQTIEPNSVIRLKLLTSVLFTGVVKSVDAMFVKDGKTAININCVDKVELLNVERAPDMAADTFEKQYERLCLNAGLNDVSSPAAQWSWMLNQSTDTLSYWDQFFMSANSVSGFVSLLKNGDIYMFNTPRTGASNIIEFSDIHDASNDKHSCFSELQFAYDTTATINDLTLNNHKGVFDAGEWKYERTTHKYEDPNSVQGYGRSPQTADTNLATAADIDRLATLVFDNFDTPQKRVNSITFPLENYAHAEVDFDKTVSVALENVLNKTEFSIIGVEHSIEPDSWVVTLNLIAN